MTNRRFGSRLRYFSRENDRLDIKTAPSSDKGLELLEENNYDAIVSDYQMPGTDGLEFLEVVREERDSQIPFIIFTGKGREEVAMEALNLGANRYLQKGGSPKSQYGVLAEAIAQEVKHTRLSKEKVEAELSSLVQGSEDPIYVVDETDAERLVLDSVSSLPSAGLSEDKLRQILLQLNSALKARGVTGLMTHLESGLFGQGTEQLLGTTQASDLRLSSLCDGIVILRYVERENKVGKAMHVLKMRGCDHDKYVRELDISDQGIKIGEVFEKMEQ